MTEERNKAINENTLIAQLNPALQAKDWATAEPILTKLIAMNPNRWDYQQALGNAQFGEGKFEEAVATYEKAIPIAENASKGDAQDPKGLILQRPKPAWRRCSPMKATHISS